MPDGFPKTVYITYLLQPWVKEHLGAQVDYVEVSVVVDMGKLKTEKHDKRSHSLFRIQPSIR